VNARILSRNLAVSLIFHRTGKISAFKFCPQISALFFFWIIKRFINVFIVVVITAVYTVDNSVKVPYFQAIATEHDVWESCSAYVERSE